MATCDAPSPASLSNEEFLSLMHNKLPPYVVKCLLAAGFDVVEVVASMDISEKPGNTIEAIEKFINQHFSDKDEYTMSLKPFVFPPGHRMRLSNFVSQLRAARHVIATRKTNVRLPTRISRQQATIATSNDGDATQGDSSISVGDASTHIRSLIAKWVQRQSMQPACPYSTLTENEHFVVKVSRVAMSRLSAFVECCACKSNIKLQTRTQGINTPSYLISNWTRHVKRCSLLASKLSGGKSLLDLLLPPASSSGATTKISNDASVNESESERSEFVRSDPADVAIFFSVAENNFVSAAVESTGFVLTDENMTQEASSGGIQQENMSVVATHEQS